MSFKGKGKGKGKGQLKSKGKSMKLKGKGKGYIRNRALKKKSQHKSDNNYYDYSDYYYHYKDDSNTGAVDSLVPICYYDPYKHIYTTECVDRNQDLPFLNAHAESYVCGCCSTDLEFSGHLPDYCPSLPPPTLGNERGSAGQQQSSNLGMYSSYLIDATSTRTAYKDHFGCPAAEFRACSHPDIFVHGLKMAVCHVDEYGNSETLCLHPGVNNNLQPGDTYTCGCCSPGAESNRPLYC